MTSIVIALSILAILSCPFHTNAHKSSQQMVMHHNSGLNFPPTRRTSRIHVQTPHATKVQQTSLQSTSVDVLNHCKRESFYKCASTSGAAAFAIPTQLGGTELWIIRTVSALATYFGLVAYTDRPRGHIDVPDPSILDVRQSNVPGAGLGLFYAGSEPLRKGTVLGTYPGVVIPLQQNLGKLRDYPQCEGYVWRFGDNQFVIDPTDYQGNIQFYVRGGNPSTIGSQLLFSSLLSWWKVPTILCRINEPPKGFDVNVVTDEDSQNRCVVFSLERDVYPGEEFYIDYGPSYDRSGYGGPPPPTL